MSANEARVAVPENLHGERLDKALAALVPALSRHKARKVLAMGAVTLNGRRVRMAGYLVRTNDRLVATWHDDVLTPEQFPLQPIHEDASVLVLLKPSGQLSQGSELGDVGSLTHALMKHYGQDVRLMHRLDKGTSGLMVAARGPAASAALTPQFRDHTIGRRYLALVTGILDVEVTCEAPLRQNARLVRVAAPGEEGMSAHTVFAPRGIYQHPDIGLVSLVEATLHTGRTHQIRVHAAHLGHPLVGDPTYGGPEAPRMALHAAHLAFTHPDGRPVSFDAPLPPDFQGIIDRCTPVIAPSA
jgi:23S rRNA pseudouridine1911/1915/1917 synthase